MAQCSIPVIYGIAAEIIKPGIKPVSNVIAPENKT